MNDNYLFAPCIEMGPRCENDGCEGILRNYISLATNISFRRCSVCERELDRAPFTDRVEQLEKLLGSILNGEYP